MKLLRLLLFYKLLEKLLTKNLTRLLLKSKLSSLIKVGEVIILFIIFFNYFTFF